MRITYGKHRDWQNNLTKTKMPREEAYKSISVVEVVPPKRSEFLLATNIPNREHHILVLNFLNVESCVPKLKREMYKAMTKKMYTLIGIDISNTPSIIYHS